MACELDVVEQGEVATRTEVQRQQAHVRFRYREDTGVKRKTNREDERKAAEIQKKLATAVQSISASQAKLDEFVLVPKVFFNERLAEIKELEERMQNMKTESEHVLEQKTQENDERIQNLKLKEENDRHTSEDKYDTLFNDLTHFRDRHEAELHQSNDLFDARTKELEAYHENRVSEERSKQNCLLEEKQRMKDGFEAEKRELEQQHDELVEELRTKHQKHKEEWKAKYDAVCNLLKSDGLKFEESLYQQGNEYEEQIVEILEHKRLALEMESRRSMQARTDTVSRRQTISMLQVQVKAQKEELEKAQAEINSLKRQLADARLICDKTQEQLQEAKRGMKVKDDSYAKLREQMKHLDSFRFALFHKVRSLEEEREPLEEQVELLKTNVREMYNEFVREFRQKQEQAQKLGSKTGLAESLQFENVDLRSQLAQLKKDGRRLLQDVEQVLHAESTDAFESIPKLLQEVVVKHKKLVQWAPPPQDGAARPEPEATGRSKEGTADVALIEEMMTQRDLLFRKNQIAVGQANHANQNCAQDLRRLISENSQLIAEMNTLRNERMAWQRSCKQLESDLMAAQAGKSGLSRVASAPSLEKSPGCKGPADTPYVRRKVVDHKELQLREKQKKLNQLPPVAAQGGRNLQEKRFERTMEKMQAGRQQMERQGFDVRKLSDTASSPQSAEPGTSDGL